MAEVVNLRLARKARDRSRAAEQAATNRARHGQTKAERTKREREQERADRLLDGAQREGADD